MLLPSRVKYLRIETAKGCTIYSTSMPLVCMKMELMCDAMIMSFMNRPNMCVLPLKIWADIVRCHAYPPFD